MADQAEKVILEAEETPVLDSVGRANAALDSFEKKAESSNLKVIRISDQTRSSVQRLIASLEKQAETYGKTGVERLISQRDQLLQRYSKEPQAIDAITKSYEKMISVEERGHASVQKLGLAMKDVFEGRTNYAGVEVGKFIGSRSGMAAVAAAGATALLGLVAGAVESGQEPGRIRRDGEGCGTPHGADRERGRRVQLCRARRGPGHRDLRAHDARAFAGGRRYVEGRRKARTAMQRMGISLVDANTGALKPTAQVFEEISEGLSKLPNVYERNAAALALFKRAGMEAIPVIAELPKICVSPAEQGYGPSEEDVKRFTEYQREVTEAEMAWERFTRSIKEPLAATVVCDVQMAGDRVGHGDAAGRDPRADSCSAEKRTAVDIEMRKTEG